MGALPVIGFLGLDVLLLWWCLRLVRTRQQAQTRITITAARVTLIHHSGDGTEKRAEMPSPFARVDLERGRDARITGLRLGHGHTAFVIGRFLAPADCESLVRAIRDALSRARLERLPDA